MKYRIHSALLALLTFLILWGGLAAIYYLERPASIYWLQPSNLVRA